MRVTNHQRWAADAFRETGEVFDIGSRGELTTRCDPICQKPFIENGCIEVSGRFSEAIKQVFRGPTLQVCARKVYCRRMGSRARAECRINYQRRASKAIWVAKWFNLPDDCCFQLARCRQFDANSQGELTDNLRMHASRCG